MKRTGADRCWWLVSPQNPLKPAEGMAPLAERLVQARRVATHPRLTVTDIERALGTRATADTVRRLQQRFPRHRFVWLMGADNLAGLHRWKRWRQLIRLLPIVVVDRAPYHTPALTGRAARVLAPYRIKAFDLQGVFYRKPPAWAFLHLRTHPLSATDIRARSGPEGLAIS